MRRTGFYPRRLGHVNLWVSDVEKSIDFYQRVCGIRLVRREPGLRAGFLSNGNTHHDIAVVEAWKGEDRFGRDGSVQVSAADSEVSLSHLGWEMVNESQLVEAYRALKGELSLLGCADHLISHSVYVRDADGNGHEFYADAIPDWRTVFNLEREDDVTADWDPLAAPASTAEYYPRHNPQEFVAGAPLRPVKITGVQFATRSFDAMREFLTRQGGLRYTQMDRGRMRCGLFEGQCQEPNLVLAEVAEGEPTGLRLFSFMLHPDTDLDRAAEALAAKGERVQRHQDSRRRSLILEDPDRFRIEFYQSADAGQLESLVL